MPTKKCEQFCKTTFIKERERVESKVAKENGTIYVPAKKLANKPLGQTLLFLYEESCKKKLLQ